MSCQRCSAAVIAALCLALLLSCSSPEPERRPGVETAEELTVFAAASLTKTFTSLGEGYTEQSGQRVRFSFAGSSDLVAQLQAGAPADVLATADRNNMAKAGDLINNPRVFATNTLVIVTQPGNPDKITQFSDLSRDDLVTVICAPQVPCGNATRTLAELNRVKINAASEESQVTDVVAKVASGEADAGVVYRTDAAASPDLGRVDIPRAGEVVNDYLIGVVAVGEQSAQAQAFIDFVNGPQGRAVMTAAGFGAPE